jgi:digeranylgeranylglycerophospholipid reductase
MTDLVIVGGGPVGSTVASLTSSSISTVILEEHAQVGFPVQCTGLVAPRVVENASARTSVINSLNGVVVHFPGGQVLEVSSQETKAMVIDRTAFDRICSDRALDAGASLRTDAKFLSLSQSGGRVRIEVREKRERKSIDSPLLIGADGYKSKVSRAIGLEPTHDVVRGIQVDLNHSMDDQRKVHMFLGRTVAPGFFGWLIPCGDFTRVGLGVSRRHGAPSQYLHSLLRTLELDGAERKRMYSGAIPIGAMSRTYSDNVLIVGDAAGHTKPLSGGGIYTGMRAAGCAARTALEAHAHGNFSAPFLSRYQECWKSEIGKELDRGLRVRKVFVRLNDKKLDEVGRLMNRPDVIDLLSQGDIDYPTRLAPSLLRSIPSLLRLSPQIIGSFLWKE